MEMGGKNGAARSSEMHSRKVHELCHGASFWQNRLLQPFSGIEELRF